MARQSDRNVGIECHYVLRFCIRFYTTLPIGKFDFRFTPIAFRAYSRVLLNVKDNRSRLFCLFVPTIIKPRIKPFAFLSSYSTTKTFFEAILKCKLILYHAFQMNTLIPTNLKEFLHDATFSFTKIYRMYLQANVCQRSPSNMFHIFFLFIRLALVGQSTIVFLLVHCLNIC